MVHGGRLVRVAGDIARVVVAVVAYVQVQGFFERGLLCAGGATTTCLTLIAFTDKNRCNGCVSYARKFNLPLRTTS